MAKNVLLILGTIQINVSVRAIIIGPKVELQASVYALQSRGLCNRVGAVIHLFVPSSGLSTINNKVMLGHTRCSINTGKTWTLKYHIFLMSNMLAIRLHCI